MVFLKKEWKTLVTILWLAAITVFMIRINDHTNQLLARNAKMASTLDSVESVVISTDANIVQANKMMSDSENNLNFIVEKIRRR